MSRFLGGKNARYKTFSTAVFDGVQNLTGTATIVTIDCKIVTKEMNQYNRRQPPVDFSEVIDVFLTFIPDLGAPNRKPAEIEHKGQWYIFYAYDEPGVVMPHYTALAYLPTGIK